MSLHLSWHSEGSASRHSSMSTASSRLRSRRGPATAHAASLLSLQLWAISELRHVLPPLGEWARAARLLFLGLVAALVVAMVLSYLLGAFIRLFSLSRPPSVRRRRALTTLAVYLVLACLSLCLAEKWTAVEAAYYATATLTTVGCRDLVVRSVAGKVVATTLSIVGPLAGAFLWRDTARARSAPQHHHHQSEAGAAAGRAREGVLSGSSMAGGGLYSQPAKSFQEEEEEAQEARVADALWACVGVLMVLAACAVVFLRVSRGGEQQLAGQGRGNGSPRTVLDAAHAAILTLTTVGPAAPHLAGVLSPAARALLIPLMLLGALIFSRATWALVDVLSPPLGDVGASAGGTVADGITAGSPSASPPPMLSRLDGVGGDGFKPADSSRRRDLPQETVGIGGGGGRDAAWNGGGAGARLGEKQQRQQQQQQQRLFSAERGKRLDAPGVVSPVVSRAAPPTPTATLIEDGGDETEEDDGEEDDGWVSEDEGTVRRGSKNSTTVEVDVGEESTDNVLVGGAGSAGVVDTAAGVTADDGGTAAEEDPPVVVGSGDGHGGVGVGGAGNLDAAPSVRRSWRSGGVWKGEMSPEEQAEQAAAAAAAAASAEALQQRRAAAAARFRARQLDAQRAAVEAEQNEEEEGEEEEEEEEEGDGGSEVESDGRYSHQPSLASIGEGDEEDEDDDEDSSDYDSEGKDNSKGGSGSGRAWRQRFGQAHAGSRAGGAAAAEAGAEEERALTADEFILKRLLDQGKLGRMEAAQMMLEFQQAAVPQNQRGGGSSAGAGGGGGGNRATKAGGGEKGEQGTGRQEEDDDDDHDDRNDDDEVGMAPPGLAKLVGDATCSPQAPAPAPASAVASAPAVAGGFRGGGGGGVRGRAAPLGTPHLRGGRNGSGARPPVAGGQHQHQQQQQQQQQRYQVEQQNLEAEKQQEQREEEEYERQQQEQQEGRQPATAGVPVPVGVAEDEVFAATRSPSVDYDSLAPPGI